MDTTLQGMVKAKIFYRNGFGIYTVDLMDDSTGSMVIKGNLAELDIDECYEFKGEYQDDAKYGQQFKVYSYVKVMPTQRESVIRYLSSPLFVGIGLKSATALVDAYGADIIEKVRLDPDIQLQLRGVSSENLANLKNILAAQTIQDETFAFLYGHGLSNPAIEAIIKHYGERSIDVVSENPYRLAEEVVGIGFATADRLARSLDFDFDHPYRIEAYIIHRYKERVFGNGDSYIDQEELFTYLKEIEPSALLSAFDALVERRVFVIDDHRVYHHTQYDSEVYVASFLRSFFYNGSEFEVDDIDQEIATIEKDMFLTFDATQKEVIASFMEEDLLILSGGPGTGKSTLLAGIIRLLQASAPWINVTLCAPTGRAAKRLEQLTNVSASTIHSIFKWDLHTNQFSLDEDNPLISDVLIIDEFSMVDIWLFYNVLKASSKIKKFLFVGDQHQLPSVNSGLVLKDMIHSQRIKTIELTHNYRQSEGSEVIDLALAINRGHFSLSTYQRDVIHYECGPFQVRAFVLNAMAQALEKGYSIHEILVLAPMYETAGGINELNHGIQNMFNPKTSSKNEIVIRGRMYREGDKILQLKNQPNDFVFNGDIGILIEINDFSHDVSVVVDFDGNVVEYDMETINNITHAYCVSIHKAQGSESPVTIVVATHNFRRMLSRQIYYTAITRSSKALILVGQASAFAKAAATVKEIERQTYLANRLISEDGGD